MPEDQQPAFHVAHYSLAAANLIYNTCVALLFVAILALFAWLMITRRLPATLALPAAALTLAIVALIPQFVTGGASTALTSLISDVLEDGVTRLSSAIFAVLLGAVLAAQMRVTGAAERMIRYATEYAGENRLLLALLLLAVISLLFTSLGGLGAVILVASITLPLMFSMGFEPRVTGSIFLFGLSLGGCLNPVNWQLFKDVLQIDPVIIVPYALAVAGVFFVVCCVYLAVNLALRRADWKQLAPAAGVLLIAAIAAAIVLGLPAVWSFCKQCLSVVMLLILALLAVLALIRLVLAAFPGAKSKAAGWQGQPGNWLAGASVLVPLLLLLWSSLNANISNAEKPLGIPILTALLAGIVYCALASYCRDGASANRLMRALFEGVSQAAPAVVLMIGIGLLLQATALPAVAGSFSPWLAHLPLATPFGFVLLFFVLSPLALYRGPLNLWGMGSGVVGMLAATGVLPAPLIMVAFFSVGQLQGVCDPTNTHNVWIANFCRIPVSELTRATLAWTLVVVLLGLVIGAAMFGANFAHAI
jgi:C4-dicarboxylate transporter, DcuC family